MKFIKKIFLILLVFVGITFLYFFMEFGVVKDIVWGANFSQKQATSLQLDWKEVYRAIIEDLKVKELKVTTYWDLLEPERDKFQFADIDWQIEQAQKNDASIMLVIGMKTPRWPECHIPGWANELTKEEQQKEILEMLEAVVKRYRDSEVIWAWQVENEIFFEFGVCPWREEEFLKKEVELVHLLDSSRPVVVTDSGEWSFWTKPAQIGDIVGVTMYRKAWFSEYNRYITYPHPPISYGRRASIIKFLFGKEVMGVELQAEPWVPVSLLDASFKEQEKTMSLERFKQNVDYARRSGLSRHYLWGVEWMYWMKEVHQKPEIWLEAKKLNFLVNP